MTFTSDMVQLAATIGEMKERVASLKRENADLKKDRDYWRDMAMSFTRQECSRDPAVPLMHVSV